MAIGLLIPLKSTQIGDTTYSRINAMPGREILEGQNPVEVANRGLMGGAGYHNPFAPLVTPVADFPIPSVGNSFHSRTDTNGTYAPSDPREQCAWTAPNRLRLAMDWAQGYLDPSDVPSATQAIATWTVISVASADDLYIEPTGDRGWFRVGTVMSDGTFAQCVTYGQGQGYW